jgi:hypothetical protein
VPAHLLNLEQVLDVGFRVVGLSSPLEMMRMVQILIRGMNSRNVLRMLQKRGLALKGEGYLAPPTPHMPGGKVCSFIFACLYVNVNCMLACARLIYESIHWEQACSDTPSDKELYCADFYDIGVKETVKDEKKESGLYLCRTGQT